MRVVFMGSDILSCPFLIALLESPEFEVCAVVTQPDRARGRHKKVTPGPVKEIALKYDLPVFSPVKMKTDTHIVEALAGLGVDAFIVMAYGQILSELVLDIPLLGCINLHVSLLPRWRGAAPIQSAIMAGDTITGVTAMMMDKGMDTGDILGQVRCSIEPHDTAGDIGAKLTEAGCDLMINVLRSLYNGDCPREPQNHALATYAHKIQKADAFIDWNLSAVENERKIRAFSPKPGAVTYIPATEKTPALRIKVMEAQVEPLPSSMALAMPGTLLQMDVKKGPLIAGGAGKALRLLKVLPEGGNRAISGADFANGYRTRIPFGIRFTIPENNA